jgi:hypothetical protein
MDKAVQIAEKSYYFYQKCPRFIQLIIKFIYWILAVIYKIIRKIYRFFKNLFFSTKKSLIESPINEEKKYINITNTITDRNNIIKDDYYLPKKKLKKGKLNISWVIPLPIEGSGGHRNFYRIIRYLANDGHNVTLYVDPENYYLNNGVYTGKDVQKFIKGKFFDLNSNIIMGLDDIKECDILFATHYNGAYAVKANENKAKMCCYFIQDYEAYFNPMGDNFIRAYQTYKFGFYPITSGYWPLNFLKKDFGITEGYAFKFPINTNIYNFNGNFDNKKENQIVFFAKPNMPRRCYNLGVASLKIVKEKHPEVDIVFYGANSNEYQNVPFEFINKGLLPTIEDLGNLYRESAIGVVFSTTNPSLVPYEMMSCGCAVVDLDFNDNIINYEDEKNITLAEPQPEKVAEAIIGLLENKKGRISKAKNGMNLCKSYPTEEEMCKGIEDALLKEYSRRVKYEK